MSIAATTQAKEPAAPIERVTIPLRPRTPSGCCDLAVMYYGRHVAAALRLWLAVAGPAVALVYGLGRFAGADLAAAIITGIVVSKQLGALTVAAAVRTTFGEPFERPGLGLSAVRTREGRLRELTRSIVTAAAALAAGALIAATYDDAYGSGRLAALGIGSAASVVLLAAIVLFTRAQIFLLERHSPGRGVWKTALLGTLVRVLLAAPLALMLFEATRAWGIGLAFLWLPVLGMILLRRSLRAEKAALDEIDPSLHTSQADAALGLGEMLGPAFTVVSAASVLTLVALAAVEFAFTTAGLPGPISGPVGDSFDPEFFEPGSAGTALGRSPLFAASALAAALFAYQVGRIAWFFAYVDARVRRDCWDMELTLAREAKRLEGE